MTTLKTIAHIGPTGDVVLRLPAMPERANSDIEVLVILDSSNAHGHAAAASVAKNGHGADDRWRAHIDRFAGSMPDFPGVDRDSDRSFR